MAVVLTLRIRRTDDSASERADADALPRGPAALIVFPGTGVAHLRLLCGAARNAAMPCREAGQA